MWPASCEEPAQRASNNECMRGGNSLLFCYRQRRTLRRAQEREAKQHAEQEAKQGAELEAAVVIADSGTAGEERETQTNS